MAQKTFPRSQQVHEVTADMVIRRHESNTGKPIELPVPIDLIIEVTYGLSILYEPIDEPPNTMILGALSPSTDTIVLNETHSQLFEDVLGPERFTLAHELGHWVYDADSPGQQTLELDSPSDVFCYHRKTSISLSNTTAIREVNANKFASCLLLPKHLVEQATIDDVMSNFAHTARQWGVSQQTLQYRLEALGLIDDLDVYQLDLN